MSAATTGEAGAPGRSAALAALAGIAVLAAALRALGWETWSLWLDEAMTLDYARRGLRGLLDVLVLDGNHPPAHYLVISFVRRVSETDAALRSPSVIFAVGTAVALFVRCGGPRRAAASLGAAFAFAVVPLAVHYGQDVRPYSMALCCVAGADAARVTWRDRRSRASFAVWVAASVLAAYTLYFALVPIATMLAADVASAWRTRREDPVRLRAPLAVGLLTVSLFLPWVWAIRHGLHQPPASPPPLTPKGVWTELVALGAGRDENMGRQPAAVFVWLVFAAGFVRSPREERWRTGLDLAATTVGVLALLSLAHHWWSPRYVVLGLLPLSRGLGEAFGRAAAFEGVRVRRAVAGGLAAALVAVEAPALAENARSGRTNWRPAAAYLESAAASGRGGEILAADGWAYFCLRAQTTRLATPRDVVLSDQPDVLRAKIASPEGGWIARAPHYGGVRPEVDALLAGARLWVTVREADDVRLYRFEGGRLVAP